MADRFPLDRDLRGAVVALGNFDGVHLGHRSVVRHAAALARREGRPSLAVTFAPHPVRYFNKSMAPFLLTDVNRRLQLLRAAGADEAVALPFDAAMAALPPEEFVRHWLHDMLGAQVIVTGDDFHFGRNRAGDLSTLRQVGAPFGMTAQPVPILAHADDAISSTRIRGLVREGRLAETSRLLGRSFELTGTLLHRFGEHVGIDLGDHIRPLAGRYRGRLHLSGLTFEGVPVHIDAAGCRCVLGHPLRHPIAPGTALRLELADLETMQDEPLSSAAIVPSVIHHPIAATL
jgi:riboflavin kinase/FMN adenylyltransferase